MPKILKPSEARSEAEAVEKTKKDKEQHRAKFEEELKAEFNKALISIFNAAVEGKTSIFFEDSGFSRYLVEKLCMMELDAKHIRARRELETSVTLQRNNLHLEAV